MALPVHDDVDVETVVAVAVRDKNEVATLIQKRARGLPARVRCARLREHRKLERAATTAVNASLGASRQASSVVTACGAAVRVGAHEIKVGETAARGRVLEVEGAEMEAGVRVLDDRERRRKT